MTDNEWTFYEGQENPQVFFMCAFCAQECSGDIQIALIENPGREDAREQFWFAHFGCFEKAIHERARVFAGEDDPPDSVRGNQEE